MPQRPHQDAILAICHKTYILSTSMLKLLNVLQNSEKSDIKKKNCVNYSILCRFFSNFVAKFKLVTFL